MQQFFFSKKKYYLLHLVSFKMIAYTTDDMIVSDIMWHILYSLNLILSDVMWQVLWK